MDPARGVAALALICVFLFLASDTHSADGKRNLFSERIIEVNKTYYDDVYDCVDFYKQPAFDHPALANHTFHHEMRPSSTPKPTTSKVRHSLNMEFQFKGKSCPTGTVPIRRITTEDRIRERLHLEKYGSEYNMLNTETPVTHYAIARTRSNPTKKYNGAGAQLSSWNPFVRSSQYSSSQISIRNGRDYMQVGWTVNPTLYGDSLTRLFIYTSAGATQCLNTHCPGFVIVNKDIPIDGLVAVSKENGPTYHMNYMIYKDTKDGNWWLNLNYKAIGFWPRTIFTDLADVATSVEWGGKVGSPPNVPSPPMGSGHFPSENTKLDAYCGLVSVINEAHQIVDTPIIDAYSDTPRYAVKLEGNVGGNFGNLVIFGGPGGVTRN